MFEATCIVSKTNIYVNQQQNTNPYLIEFNIDEQSQWIPFLN